MSGTDDARPAPPPTCLAKASRRLRSLGDVHADPLAFLVLSGSLSPIHGQHMRALEVARDECQRLGWAVVGGFLAPSGDDYVREKLGESPWALDQRTVLCELASKDSDWVGVWPVGERSGYRVCVEIRKQLLKEHPEILTGRTLAAVEVMGSDTAIRILDTLAEEWLSATGGASRAWYQDRVVCCLVRPGRNGAEEAEHVRGVTAPRVAAVGVQIILADTTRSGHPLEPVSSAEIRELMALGDWEGLRVRGWLHPRVFGALEAQARS